MLVFIDTLKGSNVKKVISKSDTKLGIVVCDGVECFKDSFVLGTFRKTFNDEGKRLEFTQFEKHLKKNIQATYQAAKDYQSVLSAATTKYIESIGT